MTPDSITIGSSLNHQVELPVHDQDFNFDTFACALEPQIGARLADFEATNLDVIDEFREDRADNAQAVFVSIRLESQQGCEQIRHRPGGPGLGLTRDRVRNGNAVIIAVESAE